MKALRFLGMVLLACSVLFVSCKKDKQYTITVNANDTTMGTVTGGGVYEANATATLTATANTGYKFVKWQDGNTSNPRTITVTKDETYTATFEALPDGVYVVFGSLRWDGAYFIAEATNELLAPANRMIIQLQQSSNSDYPMIQTLIPNIVNTLSNQVSTLHYTLFMAHQNDLDAEGKPNWQSTNLTTAVTAIDLTAQTISATQTGMMKHSQTDELRNIDILFKNATWQAATFTFATKKLASVK